VILQVFLLSANSTPKLARRCSPSQTNPPFNLSQAGLLASLHPNHASSRSKFQWHSCAFVRATVAGPHRNWKNITGFPHRERQYSIL